MSVRLTVISKKAKGINRVLIMSLNTLKIFVSARRYLVRLVVTLLAIFTLFGFTGTGHAICTDCGSEIESVDSSIWKQSENRFDSRINARFRSLQNFIIHDMWEQSILPAMMLAAEQFTVVALQQVMAIGMFIDAESQMDAQRLLQEIRADVHKRYQPSVGMCEFGSVMKSIAVTERRGEVMAVTLAQRSQDRQLGQQNTSGTYGNDLDHDIRIMHFKNLFCNEKDRGSALSAACSLAWTDTSFDADARVRINKDIDYFSLVDSPWTLTLDFTNDDIIDDTASLNPEIHNEDEEHLLAMASNLYAHNTFPRIPARLLVNRVGKDLTTMQKSYMDMRSIIAKRSVAENSFYAIAAMKAEGNRLEPPTGSPPSAPDSFPMSARIYMQSILEELGVPATEILTLLGDNPSYYAQMEVLTKKLYQNPDFYTNLYDKPANVERKIVALQAIKLMQKFDVLKSSLRNEVSTSVLLELAVMDLQREIEDQIQAIGVGDE